MGDLIAALALPLASAFRFIVSSHPFPLSLWPHALVAAAFWTLSAAVLMTPISIASLCLWVVLVRRMRRLDSSLQWMTLGLLLLSLVLAFVTGVFSSWESIVYPNYPDAFWSSARDVARDVLPGILPGLLLPRLLVRPLRPGAFSGQPSTAAV
jgi:uncharacterized membrane protein